MGREIRQIIFEHFDQITAAWREHFEGAVPSETTRFSIGTNTGLELLEWRAVGINRYERRSDVAYNHL